MTQRILLSLVLSASIVGVSVAQAASNHRTGSGPAVAPASAEPLCGGSGTKNPPDGPQPPKEPPKT
jgi:hypothetical protein